MSSDLNNDADNNNPQNTNTTNQETLLFSSFYIPTLVLSDFDESSHPTLKLMTCDLCKGILYEPVRDEYNNCFCKKCLEIHLMLSQNCPTNNTPYSNFKFNKIPALERCISSFKLFCKNRNSGCNWQGFPNQLQGHLNTDCPKQIVPCPNDCCFIQIQRELLQTHIEQCQYNITKCKDCNNDLIIKYLSAHEEDCPSKGIHCNKCAITIPRRKMDEHLAKNCMNEEEKCPFSEVGCEIIMTRKELKEHYIKKNNLHMKGLGKEMDKFKENIVSDMKERIDAKYNELRNEIMNRMDLRFERFRKEVVDEMETISKKRGYLHEYLDTTILDSD